MRTDRRRNTIRNINRNNNLIDDNVNTETVLIHEYIGLMREVLHTSTRASTGLNNTLSSLLTNINILFDNYYRWGREQNQTQNSQTSSNFSFSTPFQTPSRNTFSSPTTTDRSWADVVSGSTTRRNNRRNTRMRNRRLNRPTHPPPITPIVRPESNLTNRVISRPLTTFQTFLNNTLNTASYPSYTLSREQINNSLTTVAWRDIRNSTDQTLCPINQVAFTDDEMVSRINRCGHVFSTSAINNYLLNYDNRCPVCRTNLSINLNNIPPTNNITSSQTAQTTTNTESTSASTDNTSLTRDAPITSFTNRQPRIPQQTRTSTNATSTVSNQTQDTLSSELNNAVNLASNAFVNELTNSLFGTNNTPSQINAEYSLFIPTTTNTQQNSTSFSQPSTTGFSWTNSFTSNLTNSTNIPEQEPIPQPEPINEQEPSIAHEPLEEEQLEEEPEVEEEIPEPIPFPPIAHEELEEHDELIEEPQTVTEEETENVTESAASRYVTTYVERTLHEDMDDYEEKSETISHRK